MQARREARPWMRASSQPKAQAPGSRVGKRWRERDPRRSHAPVAFVQHNCANGKRPAQALDRAAARCDIYRDGESAGRIGDARGKHLAHTPSCLAPTRTSTTTPHTTASNFWRRWYANTCCASTDARGFITAAYQLGLDPETRRVLGANARRAAQRCPPDAVIAEFEKLLNSLAVCRALPVEARIQLCEDRQRRSAGAS